MNKTKLKAAKEQFLQLYPGGFNDIQMKEVEKKHKPQKMMNMAQEYFRPEAFQRPEQLLEQMIGIVISQKPNAFPVFPFPILTAHI